MYTLKVISVNYNEFSKIIQVTVDMFKGTKKVERRVLGFGTEVADKELESELKKFVKTYNEDMRLAEESKKAEKVQEEIDKNVDKLKSLEGETIK